MITRPLNLQAKVKMPTRRFDVIALFDILVIAFGFTLLSSRFIFAPGITIDLPLVGEGELAGMRTDAVLTIGANDMLFFEGAILDFDSLQGRLREHFDEDSDASLLIRADRSISMQTLMEVAELARSAGIARVQVAAGPDGTGRGPDFVEPGAR